MTDLSETGKLIIFVKDAVSGEVKTRLASEIGEDHAAAVYEAMIRDLAVNVESSAFEPVYYLGSPEITNPRIRQSLDKYTLHTQTGSDLGERMDNAFRAEFSKDADRVLLIGSDIPLFTRRTVEHYRFLLGENDAVIGPTFDGGYYCIGFHRLKYASEVFYRIPWSTRDVFRITLQKLESAEITIGTGPRMRDLDTLEDLKTLMSSPAFQVSAPETARAADLIT